MNPFNNELISKVALFVVPANPVQASTGSAHRE
jgi:hypothetical protein